MTPIESIAAVHEKILQLALDYRAAHPDFTFRLRTSDITGKSRLAKGYWFLGNEDYLFFSPFALRLPNSRTQTIGFLVKLDGDGRPESSYLQVVFGSITDPGLKALHEEILREVEGFSKSGKGDRYQKLYPSADPATAFKEFVHSDLPAIRMILTDSGREAEFLVPESDFQKMIERVEAVKSSMQEDQQTHSNLKTPAADWSPLNLILFGPPGTGKTYWLRKRLAEYTDTEEQVSEDAWLQAQVEGYGWRPVIAAALAEFQEGTTVPELKQHPWIQAKVRERGRVGSSTVHQTIWGVLQGHTPEEVETVKFANRWPPFIFTKTAGSVWSVLDGWEKEDPDAAELRDLLRGGPRRTGKSVRRYRVVTFHPSFSYEDFVRGIRPVVDSETGSTEFRTVDGVFKEICEEARLNQGQRYALFIDEINRANISKVFGELITLIEPDKRARYDENGRQTGGMSVQLPGGQGSEAKEEPFGVPENLDIYGTMNTADRSIALLDIALRRRFEFQEMLPDYGLLDEPVGEIDVGAMLSRINDRLELLIDSDHAIGHAYLMEADSLDALRTVFQSRIIPLLQEYFFDDFSRVALVLSTAKSAPPFLHPERLSAAHLFPGSSNSSVPRERERYRITPPESWTEASFVSLYSLPHVAEPSPPTE